MLTFNEYKYVRPDMETFEKEVELLIEDFNKADTVNRQAEVIRKINILRDNFDTMANIGEIRHTIDTTDEFYEKENDFLDEASPIAERVYSKYANAIVNSKFRKELEDIFGKQLFVLADMKLKTFEPEILELLQEENKLSSNYTKLKASAKIMFDGKELNLAQLEPYTQSKDRDMRKSAYEAVTSFYVENEDEFDRIYHELVQIRHKIATTLGYKNFVELGYARMMRSDYTAADVAKFRNQIHRDLVPVASNLRDRQAKRLGLDALKYYDESLEFLSGNAVPKGSHDWIVDQAKTMYKELSPETNEFFKYMLDGELMDLVSKKGKSPGGYCTYISDYKTPFIFSNFNGTSGDVDVLTHEAGHAFQVYLSRHYEILEYHFATYEACEIHSMSMEFLTWPWMNLFFKEDEAKYKFSHLSGALLFIPYGVLVDEFQHYVYENPHVSPAERKSMWRELEKKYLPHRDYEDNDFMNRGGFWFKQGHMFGMPFYYIDYTLAQMSAFEFWKKSNEDRETTWKDYLTLCKAGGSMSFLDLLDLGNLSSPFAEGSVKSIIKPIVNWLDDINDIEL